MKKRKAPDRLLPDRGLSPDRKLSGMGATEEDGVMRWVERKPFRSSTTGPPDLGFKTMPDNARQPKARGRLNRAVLAMLGRGLEDCFDEVRKQEVPERFKLLLQRF
jgi:hypothetical protein